MLRQFIPAFRLTLYFTILTGLVYPGVVTGLCQLLFPDQANGSLIQKDGAVVGSRLIGQSFGRPEYFHPRFSAAGSGYDASRSGGSNLGPTSRKLFDRVKAAADQFRSENPDFKGPIPADMLTAGGSGLDPHISPASAEAQMSRVAKVRGADPRKVRQLIARFTTSRTLGVLGEPGVNVLELNLALDERFPMSGSEARVYHQEGGPGRESYPRAP
jgi:K+-transporting ATPase ATPase C chain